jgi:Zn finger protein HypA/HybF involved in hydrogenase expression
MELPSTILCHHCGAEANVPPQSIGENVLVAPLEGYDQESTREGYLVVLECPHCGRVRQRLTAADA